MGLMFQKIIPPDVSLGVWAIEEQEDWFLQQLQLFPQEIAQFSKLKNAKRLEWLASRLLVHELAAWQDRVPMIKDEFGKPHLQTLAQHVSISHSHGRAAAILGPTPVGIDIQIFTPKIERIRHKFLSKEEMESISTSNSLQKLHVYWGAKECLYKAYGRRKLDFCRDLFVEPFQFDPIYGVTAGFLRHPSDNMSFFDIHYESLEQYMLVYVVKKPA